MATAEQIIKIDRLHDRLCMWTISRRLTIGQRRQIDTMIAHILEAKQADPDVADQEIAHAEAIVGR